MPFHMFFHILPFFEWPLRSLPYPVMEMNSISPSWCLNKDVFADFIDWKRANDVGRDMSLGGVRLVMGMCYMLIIFK